MAVKTWVPKYNGYTIYEDDGKERAESANNYDIFRHDVQQFLWDAFTGPEPAGGTYQRQNQQPAIDPKSAPGNIQQNNDEKKKAVDDLPKGVMNDGGAILGDPKLVYALLREMYGG